MEILTAIHTRRSVRAFTPEPVSDDHINTLLEAAMIAPSAGNSQPWQFVVIDDKTILARIPEIHPYAGMAKDAPVAILVCGDTAAEKYPGFWIQDCSASIQNILLAAVGLGLGAVWTGIYPVEERVGDFSRLFSLPGTIIPLALIVIGHPRSEQNPKSRYDPSKVRRNTWS